MRILRTALFCAITGLFAMAANAMGQGKQCQGSVSQTDYGQCSQQQQVCQVTPIVECEKQQPQQQCTTQSRGPCEKDLQPCQAPKIEIVCEPVQRQCECTFGWDASNFVFTRNAIKDNDVQMMMGMNKTVNSYRASGQKIGTLAYHDFSGTHFENVYLDNSHMNHVKGKGMSFTNFIFDGTMERTKIKRGNFYNATFRGEMHGARFKEGTFRNIWIDDVDFKTHHNHRNKFKNIEAECVKISHSNINDHVMFKKSKIKTLRIEDCKIENWDAFKDMEIWDKKKNDYIKIDDDHIKHFKEKYNSDKKYSFDFAEHLR